MSDKERLDGIKQKYSVLTQLWFGGQGVSNLDIRWLIQQAERAQELEGRLNAECECGFQMEGQVHDAREENTRLREVLEFIRDHTSCDVGIKEAEKVLKGESV